MQLGADRAVGRLQKWRWLLAGAACLAAALWAWHHFATGRTRTAEPSAQAVPVHAAVAKATSFPIVLNGLGTVQATNTVTVRSRVDGQIEKVAFEEGAMVKAGDLLVQIDPAPLQAALNQAVAKVAQDRSSLVNARQDLERTSILSRQGNATQQLLDQRTATVASFAAQVQADDAAIESARVQLAYTTITSPLTGRVGFRLVDPGNIVHANDQTGMLTITQLQPISVVFTAPEQQLPVINAALKSGPLKVTTFTSDGKTELGQGSLSLVDNQVDPASGTIKLKATFANADNALWPGLSVTTRLLVDTVPHAIVVPDEAVQRGPNGLYVYVVTPASRAELRDVKVSRIEGGLALVDQGLSAGERIVTSGHYRVLPGGPIEVVDDGARPPTTLSAQRALMP
jgi:membrane fusion protein, multidrug efflux system